MNRGGSEIVVTVFVFQKKNSKVLKIFNKK